MHQIQLCYKEIVFVSQSIQHFESLAKPLAMLSNNQTIYLKDYSQYFDYRNTGPVLAILDVEGISRRQLRLLAKQVKTHRDLYILICNRSDISLLSQILANPNVVKVVKPFNPLEIQDAASLVAEKFSYYSSNQLVQRQKVAALHANNEKLLTLLRQLDVLENHKAEIAFDDINQLFAIVVQSLMQMPGVITAATLLVDNNNNILQYSMTDLLNSNKLRHSTRSQYAISALACLRKLKNTAEISSADKLSTCKAFLNLLPDVKSILVDQIELDNDTLCYLFVGRAKADKNFDATDHLFLHHFNDEINKFVKNYLLQQQSEAEHRQLLSANSKQVNLQADLEEIRAQLLQSGKMAALGQLTAGVAHEINNPVGYIKSNLGSLESYVKDLLSLLESYEKIETDLNDPDKVAAIQAQKKAIDLAYLKKDIRELVNESIEGVERVRTIVRDLKEFSHSSEDQWQYANIHEGIESTLNIIRNEIKYKAELDCQYGEIPEVKCNLPQLNQVFMNMLVNASQAIEKRGKISIATGMKDEHTVWIRFKDSGKGIKQAQLEKLFDPFFTTKPVGQGTGLGLSISRDIIAKHKGEIKVESEEGQGTSFTIYLPINFDRLSEQMTKPQRKVS